MIDKLKLRNKLTNGHDLSIVECEYLKRLMDHEEYPVTDSAEIATNEEGEVLWIERYSLNRIHGPGEEFIRDRKTYRVVASSVTRGQHRGALVEHVCKQIA